MDILKYFGIGLLIFGGIAMLIFAIKGGKPLKALLLNGFTGIFALALINLMANFSGIHIPLNPWTVGGSAIYGLPAVFGFLVLPFIF